MQCDAVPHRFWIRWKDPSHSKALVAYRVCHQIRNLDSLGESGGLEGFPSYYYA